MDILIKLLAIVGVCFILFIVYIIYITLKEEKQIKEYKKEKEHVSSYLKMQEHFITIVNLAKTFNELTLEKIDEERYARNVDVVDSENDELLLKTAFENLGRIQEKQKECVELSFEAYKDLYKIYNDDRIYSNKKLIFYIDKEYIIDPHYLNYNANLYMEQEKENELKQRAKIFFVFICSKVV